MSAITIGLGLSTDAAPGSDTVADALVAERLGFDFVSISDHPAGTHPTHETFTLLTWLAASTTRIGVASRVLAVPFRRPAMVAKAATTLQQLSGGRLVLGLGGGYSDDELRALGGPVPSPRAKVDGLADAITIMRGAWSRAGFTHAGEQHAVADLTLTPRPDPAPPVWLGTYGPRALAVTGRLADGWIPSLGHLLPADVPVAFDRIRTASVDAGRPADAVRGVVNVEVQLDRPGDDVVVGGTAADVRDRLQELLSLGFTGLNVMLDGRSQIEAFAHEVLPTLRAS